MKISKIILASLFAVSTLFAAVNINTATKEELMSIKGIGEAKADAIIEYRKINKFNSIEDIKNVKGIGDSTFDKIKGELSTGTTNSKTNKNLNEKTKDKLDTIKDKKNSIKDELKK